MLYKVKTILFLPLLVGAVALILGLFFGAPVCAIAETVDILRMRSTAGATITRVDVIFAKEGSRPQVQYVYSAAGVRYVSHRYAPGWAGNNGSWTDGGRNVRRDYWPGKVVTVHFLPSNPAHACLAYGWFKWSIGFSLGVWGMVL